MKNILIYSLLVNYTPIRCGFINTMGFKFMPDKISTLKWELYRHESYNMNVRFTPEDIF